MTATLRRADVHPTPVLDGRPVARTRLLGRLQRRAQRLLVTQRERDEAEVEQRLRSHPGVSRPHTVALISPKGGVGKTTSTFVVGNVLASHARLRVVAVDANPDFGTLARLAPDGRRSGRSLADVIGEMEQLHTAAQLSGYMSRLPSGLHVLGAPADAALPERLQPDDYGALVALLSMFYDVVLLDLGTGIVGSLVRFVTDRADRLVLVTTPEWVTSSIVLEALRHIRHDDAVVAINKAVGEPAVVTERFRTEHLHRAVTVPYDDDLAAMLDSGTYSLEALRPDTRLAVKRLALALAEQLV